MGVCSSSLLRLRPAPRGLAVVLAVICAGAGAAVAQAAIQAPDPSPALSAPGPDPYPAPFRAAATPRRPTPAQPPAVQVVRTTVVRIPVRPASSVERRKPRPAATKSVVAKPPQLPVHPAPGLGARVAAALAIEPAQRVPRTLALAVALLVLLSAAFVAGAAREVAR